MQINSKISERHFTQHVGITLSAQIVNLLFTIATAAIVARWLGPEGKGIIALALLVPGMLGLFLSCGIEVANVYFAGSRSLNVPTLTSNSMGIAMIATIVGGVILGGLVVTGWLETMVPGVPAWLVLVAAVGLPFGLLTGYFSAILQGLQRIISVNICNLTKGVLTLVLTAILVISFQMGLLGALLASLGAGVISLIAILFFLQREGGVFIPQWNPSAMRPTISFGLKGHVGNVLQFFNYRLDMFIVNYFIGPAGVGIYTVSVRLAELLWYLPNAVGFVIFPKAAATKPEVMNTFTPRVFRITLGLTALGALGLVVLGKPLILLIFSSAFLSAYIPMLALLPGVVFLGGAKVLANEIAGRGYPHYNSVNSGLALIITVLLDFLLIPLYGILGAALASSIAYTAIFITSIGFYLTVSRKTVELSPAQETTP